MDLWDDESWDLLADPPRPARSGCRSAHHATDRPQHAHLHPLLAGELAPAASLIEEAEAVTEATGSELAPYGRSALAALQGRETEVAELVESTLRRRSRGARDSAVTVTEWASALLYNGLGRYEDALAAAGRPASTPTTRRSRLGAARADRSGRPEPERRARAERARATRRRRPGPAAPTGRSGIEARSRALLSEGEAAESLYREAIERLGRTGMRVELARAHLLYGEWLRRESRRHRRPRAAAHRPRAVRAMGVEAFAERAARELLATGEKARKRTRRHARRAHRPGGQIARLARDGLLNPEIGAQLFISPRTVEYHLHKVFAKLDISSRSELQRALPSEAREAQPV